VRKANSVRARVARGKKEVEQSPETSRPRPTEPGKDRAESEAEQAKTPGIDRAQRLPSFPGKRKNVEKGGGVRPKSLVIDTTSRKGGWERGRLCKERQFRYRGVP